VALDVTSGGALRCAISTAIGVPLAQVVLLTYTKCDGTLVHLAYNDPINTATPTCARRRQLQGASGRALQGSSPFSLTDVLGVTFAVQVPYGSVPAVTTAASGIPGSSIVTSYPVGSVVFEWAPGAWSSCSPAAPQQTRAVACIGSDGSLGTAEQCGAASKPASVRAAWGWATASWNLCDATTGSRTRGVTCDGCCGLAPDSQCPAGSKPTDTELCDWQWVYGAALGPCDPVNGARYYTSACTSLADGVVDPTGAYCPAINDDSTGWDSFPCDWAYAVGDFGACDAGTGGRTRTVSCTTATDGASPATVATNAALCAGPAPASTTPCAWGWSVAAWSGCVPPASPPGPGTYTRAVTCGLAPGQGAATGGTPADALCTPSAAKPATSGACTFTWKLGSWSTCSAAGSRTRTVSCVGWTGAVSAAGDAACAARKPLTVKGCVAP